MRLFRRFQSVAASFLIADRSAGCHFGSRAPCSQRALRRDVFRLAVFAPRGTHRRHPPQVLSLHMFTPARHRAINRPPHTNGLEHISRRLRASACHFWMSTLVYRREHIACQSRRIHADGTICKPLSRSCSPIGCGAACPKGRRFAQRRGATLENRRHQVDVCGPTAQSFTLRFG